jgi:hypothetical protein
MHIGGIKPEPPRLVPAVARRATTTGTSLGDAHGRRGSPGLALARPHMRDAADVHRLVTSSADAELAIVRADSLS